MDAWRVTTRFTAPLLLAGVTGCGGGNGSEEGSGTDTSPSPVETTTAPELTSSASSAASSATSEPAFTDLDEVAEPLDIYGDWLTAGEEGVWLTDDQGLVRLDPATGDPVAYVAVAQGACEATTTGLGFVWTATCGEPGVARIDPATNQVTGHAKLPDGTFLDSEGTIGAGGDSVWIAADGQDCQDCRVARIDAASMKVEVTTSSRSGGCLSTPSSEPD